MSAQCFYFFLEIVLSLAFGVFAQDVNNDVCTYRKWERPGDVKLVIIAGIRGEGENGVCGTPSRAIFEHVVALDWVLSVLNGSRSASGDPYIPRVTIGYDLYDNCDNGDITTDLLFSGALSGQQMDCNSQPSESPLYVGAVSLTTPDSTSILSRLFEPLPVFLSLHSAPVLQSRDHPNLLQTVVSFRQEAMAIAKMLSSIGWHFIIVVHTEDASDEAEAFISLARSNAICVNFTGAPNDSTVSKIYTTMNTAYNKSVAVIYFGRISGAKYIVEKSKTFRPFGSSIHWVFASNLANNYAIEELVSEKDTIISLGLPDSGDAEFIEYFNNLVSNSSFPSPLRSLMQRYPGVFNELMPEIYPYHIVDAVLTTASSVKDIWERECSGEANIADCPAFQSANRSDITDIVKSGVIVQNKFSNDYLPIFYNKTVHFQADGTQQHDVISFNMFTSSSVMETIGTFTNGEYIAASNVHGLASSACNMYCQECQEQIDIRYSYLHGDVLILGLFSVRHYGETAFTCGHISRDTNDIITVSSFIQSVIARRNQTGIKFGAIAIDDCYNGLNTSLYIAELFSKRKIIKDPVSNTVIDFDTVISIIGALSSPVSLVVADLATSVGLPMVSYGASSPDLDNRNRYPYFLRTVPSDTLQVQGMINVVSELGVSHVGLVYINDAYGQRGKLKLVEEATSRNICVENAISVTLDMTDEYVKSYVIEELYQQQVRVVLFFGIDSIARQMLAVMSAEFSNKYEPLVFIASEAWGTNQHLIEGSIGQISKGSIVFNIATKSYNSDSYNIYLHNLQSTHVYVNRWIPRYFENYNDCNYLTSFEKSYFGNRTLKQPKLCGSDFKNTLDANTANTLYKDQRSVHTILSVFAVTEGFKKLCEPEKQPACSSHLVKTTPGAYFEFIKSTLYEENTPIFDEDGNGNIGYTIYNIQRKGTVNIVYEYEMIGSYTKDGKLKLTQVPKFYNDRQQEVALQQEYIDCYNYDATCSHVCPSQITTPHTTKTAPLQTTPIVEKTNSSLMTMTVVVVILSVLMVALVLVIVVLIRIQSRQTKHLSERGDSGGHTVNTSDVHTVYDEPGSVKRMEQFDNVAFMPDSVSLRSRSHTPSSAHDTRIAGSVSSLNVPQPTQYAHLRQMINPDIRVHHVRQISNQELRSHMFDSLERPMSSVSTPAYRPQSNQRSPFVKRLLNQQKPYKQTCSPKTPHSAPTDVRTPTMYRPRAQSSPRFRYPSVSSPDEPHYAVPTVDIAEDIPPQRRLGVSDNNMHEHGATNDSGHPTIYNVGSYLYPNPDLQCDDTVCREPESQITYITAKDLITSESEDELTAVEDDEQHVDPDPESQHAVSPQASSVKTRTFGKLESVSGITSPTDKEVMNINFPPSEKAFNAHALIATNASDAQKSNAKLSSDMSVDGDKVVSQLATYQKNNSQNRTSITDVPDIIKHGAYEEDGVFII